MSYEYEEKQQIQTKTKNSRKKRARRKCRSYLNHKCFYENFSSHPLNFFSKPMGALKIRITGKDFKRKQKIEMSKNEKN